MIMWEAHSCVCGRYLCTFKESRGGRLVCCPTTLLIPLRRGLSEPGAVPVLPLCLPSRVPGLHVQWPHPAGAQALTLKARRGCLLCHPPASGNSLLGLSALIPILPCINKQVGGLILAYSLETRSRERCPTVYVQRCRGHA